MNAQRLEEIEAALEQYATKRNEASARSLRLLAGASGFVSAFGEIAEEFLLPMLNEVADHLDGEGYVCRVDRSLCLLGRDPSPSVCAVALKIGTDEAALSEHADEAALGISFFADVLRRRVVVTQRSPLAEIDWSNETEWTVRLSQLNRGLVDRVAKEVVAQIRRFPRASVLRQK